MAKRYTIELIINTAQADAAALKASQMASRIGASFTQAAVNSEKGSARVGAAMAKAATSAVAAHERMSRAAFGHADAVRTAGVAIQGAFGPMAAFGRQATTAHGQAAAAASRHGKAVKETAQAYSDSMLAAIRAGQASRLAAVSGTIGMTGLHGRSFGVFPGGPGSAAFPAAGQPQLMQMPAFQQAVFNAAAMRNAARAAVAAAGGGGRFPGGPAGAFGGAGGFGGFPAGPAGVQFPQSHWSRAQSWLQGVGTGDFWKGSGAALTRGVGAAAIAGVDIADQMGAGRLQAARRAASMEESVRDIASMEGRTGDTLGVLVDITKMRSQTKQTHEEAVELKRTLLESAQAALKTAENPAGKITPEELHKVATESGMIGGAKGIDADAMGELAAQVVNASTGPTDAAAVMSQVRRMIKVFQATRGNPRELVRQYITASHYVDAEVGSGLYTPDEGVSTFATLAMSNPRNPGRSMGYLVRGRYSEQTEAYRRSIGVTPDMSMNKYIGAVVNDIAARQQAAVAQGKSFNTVDYMQKQGFGNLQDKDALGKMNTQWKRGMMDFFDTMIKTDVPLAAFAEEFKKFSESLPGLMRGEELAKDVANLGIGAALTGVHEAQRGTAYQNVRANQAWYTSMMPEKFDDFTANPFRNLMGGNPGAVFSSLFALSAVEAEQQRMMNLNQARAGVAPTPASMGGSLLVGPPGGWSPHDIMTGGIGPMAANAFDWMFGGGAVRASAKGNQAIKAAGGSIDFTSKELGGKLDALVKQMETLNRKVVGPGLPVPAVKALAGP